MDRRFLVILAVIIVALGGVFAFSKQSADNKSGGSSSAKPTSHTIGEGKKGVTLTEYGDFQCPVCGTYYSPLKQVMAKYNSDIYFQFSNLPLVSIHPNAFAAARAAEAAGLQNKYWQMHDKLYENQTQWSSATSALSTFKTYAKEIGLNVTQFETDYASGKVNDAINADLDAFKKTGKDQATPTFFIDGTPVSSSSLTDPSTGAPTLEKFSAVIDAEIAKKAKQ
ncbi:thioredoxin domain-containing protein [Candidatus Saccharibacteria bacterium]|nr:thioredoxin domain-containing protein [Candidatus Saccharibacteria bacterium]